MQLFVTTQHDLAYFLMPLSRKRACIHYKYLKLEPTVTGSLSMEETCAYTMIPWEARTFLKPLSAIGADERFSLSFPSKASV